VERCPFCGRQLISCECCYKKLGIDVSPGTWAYEHGLARDQEARWLAMLAKKGRIPYVQPVVLCARCGEKFPKMFRVPDAEWQHFVVPELQDQILCRPCYEDMKRLFPRGWRAVR